ncbi:unnamed protein product, partial [Durusdinium trenchii]
PSDLLQPEGCEREAEQVKAFCAMQKLNAVVASRQIPATGFAFDFGNRLIRLKSPSEQICVALFFGGVRNESAGSLRSCLHVFWPCFWPIFWVLQDAEGENVETPAVKRCKIQGSGHGRKRPNPPESHSIQEVRLLVLPLLSRWIHQSPSKEPRSIPPSTDLQPHQGVLLRELLRLSKGKPGGHLVRCPARRK